MNIEECKKEIHKVVEEMDNYNFIVQILTVARILYDLYKRDE